MVISRSSLLALHKSAHADVDPGTVAHVLHVCLILCRCMHHKITHAQMYNTQFCSMAVDMHAKMQGRIQDCAKTACDIGSDCNKQPYLSKRCSDFLDKALSF